MLILHQTAGKLLSLWRKKGSFSQRAKKRLSKPYPLMTQHRNQLRRQLLAVKLNSIAVYLNTIQLEQCYHPHIQSALRSLSHFQHYQDLLP